MAKFVRRSFDQKCEEVIILSDDDDDNDGDHSSRKEDKLDLEQQVPCNSFASEMKFTLSVSLSAPTVSRSNRNSIDLHSTGVSNKGGQMNVSPKSSYQMGNTPPLQMPICNIPSFSSKKMSLQHPKMEARTTAIKAALERTSVLQVNKDSVQVPVKENDQSLASNAVLPCKKDNCANVKRPSISSLHAVATPGISKYMIQERNVKQSVVLENKLSSENVNSCQRIKVEHPKQSPAIAESKQLEDDVPILDTANQQMESLLQLCKTFAKDDADHKILTGVGNRVLKCDKDYLNSKAFRILNKSIHDKVSNDPKNLHYYLKEYLDEIECVRRNAQRAKPKVHTKSEANEHVKEENGFRSVGGTKDASSLNGVTTSCESSSVSLEEQNSSSKARHIMKLERLLEKCSKKIQKYEGKEMSLDDLDKEDSLYIILDRYKKRSMKIWEMLCKLNGKSKKTGRVVEKKFKYEVSRYPEINQAITRLVNRSKEFPDYSDVFRVITECSENYGFRLHGSQVESLAIDIFQDVGKELKRRRILDFEEHFGCRVDETLIDNDPADNDSELKTTLEQRRKEGLQKFDEVINCFAEKQLDLEQQGSSKEDLSGGEDDPPPVDVMNESPDEDKTDDGEETDDEDIKRDELVDDVKSECASSSDSSEEAMEKELVGLDGDEKDDGDEEEEVEDEEEEECKNEGDKSSNEQKFVAVKTCGSTEENKIPESITSLPLNDRPSTSQSCCDEMKPFQLPDVGDDDSKYKNCKRLLQVPLSPEDLMVKRHRITDIVGGLQSKYLKSRAKRISEQQPCKTKETEIEVITLN